MAREFPDQSERWCIVEFPVRQKPISRFMQRDLTDEQQKAVNAYLRNCREHRQGPFRNPDKFKKLTGPEQLREMIPSRQVRLLGFFHPQKRNTFVVTNGFVKKQSKTPRREIQKAERIRQEFLEAAKGGD